ncbi:hypothetical protein E4U21_000498 [Claviceps maximensis]|nr:hypothetical protein E4U21_000498 [Claviceps maximensis]
MAPGDLNLNYCLEDCSNGHGLCGMQQPNSTYTPASPSGWFSAALINSTTTVRYHDKRMAMCHKPCSNVCTPSISGDEGFDHFNGYFPLLEGDKESTISCIWGMNIISPLHTLETSPISWSDSSVHDSPLSVGTPKDLLPSQLVESRSMPWSMSESGSSSASLYSSSASTSASASTNVSAPASASASPPSELSTGSRDIAENDKVDEPYAKLIYRAFMSRSDHTMTLQEIYKWFRENTSKAVTESRGWQNSIRHNLSMNAAFRKKEKVLFKTVKSASNSEDSKRVNEWILEDWAIRNGVQSTTRYRKSTYARRAPSGRATTATTNPWAPEHSAKRALSGRKGGCATRASRQRMRTCGKGARFDDSSQHSLDLRRASGNLYGHDQVNTIQYPTLNQPYQEGLAGGCGDEAALVLRHFGLPGPNFSHPSTNMNSNSNSNSDIHTPHTAGPYHGSVPCMGIQFGPDDDGNSCTKYREALLSCTSSSSSPRMSRSFGVPGDNARG